MILCTSERTAGSSAAELAGVADGARAEWSGIGWVEASAIRVSTLNFRKLKEVNSTCMVFSPRKYFTLSLMNDRVGSHASSWIFCHSNPKEEPLSKH